MKILMKLQAELNRREMHDPPLICGEVDLELEILYGQIPKTAAGVLNRVFDFMKKFSHNKVHNMISIMVDPPLSCGESLL